jgi:uncharacterized protein (DUF1499 family)
MPTLPTLSPTQTQFDRIVAAFPGSTLADKQANYLAWLTNNLIDFVRDVESAAVDQEINTLRAQRLAAVDASLPPRLPFPR